MYNAAIKFATAAALAAAAWSCTGNTVDSRARTLLDEASSACSAGNPARALELLDSLDSSCRGAVDIRRSGMHLRATAREALFAMQLAEADSLAMVMTARADSLKGRLQWIDNPVEGYYVARGSSLPPTGIQARLSREGVFYIVSSLSGHSVSHTSIALSGSSGSVTSATVARDGERNRADRGRELVHFVGAEADTLGRFALDNLPSVITLTFTGRGQYSRPLTRGEHEDLAAVYDYASTLTAMKVCALEHERLEKQLALARSQVARTSADTVPAGSAR